MNKEELTTLLTPQGTSHCSCLEHCFLFRVTKVLWRCRLRGEAAVRGRGPGRDSESPSGVTGGDTPRATRPQAAASTHAVRIRQLIYHRVRAFATTVQRQFIMKSVCPVYCTCKLNVLFQCSYEVLLKSTCAFLCFFLTSCFFVLFLLLFGLKVLCFFIDFGVFSTVCVNRIPACWHEGPK